MTSDAWYDEQHRLTPDQLQTISFPLTRWPRHGYEEEPVRAFLAQVQAEMVRLINERASLWQEVQRLRRRILGTTNGNDAVLFGKDDAHIHAVRILSSAQRTADRYVADAQAYSGRLTEEARTRRDEIMGQAQQHADMLLTEARTRARAAAVAAMDNEGLPPQTDQERRAVHAELAYLRTFSEVYRQHLKIYTEDVLRTIEDWESKERAAARDIPVLRDVPMSGPKSPGIR
ncbi:MAG TPA: DivIVA domain-containing protein [Streptosporangiaceae bacterium]|jgi:cell division septum initiation protein DivIVA|nr:DivIVA domain-containing protein [Streptosporangiaceae bacterium]